jgi:hypothetical protein
MARLAQFASGGVQLENTEAKRKVAGNGRSQGSASSNRAEVGALYAQRSADT